MGRPRFFSPVPERRKKVVEKDEAETVYKKDARGNQSPYVSQEQYPQVTGVLVVAKGGDDSI